MVAVSIKNKNSLLSDLRPNLFHFLVVILIAGLAYYIGTLNAEVKFHRNNISANLPVSQPNQPVPPTSIIPNLPSIVNQKYTINEAKFKNCMADEQVVALVNDSLREGQEAGVDGTPGNFLVNLSTGKAIALRGAVPYETLKNSVEMVLNNDSGPDFKDNVPGLSDSDHLKGSNDAKVALIEYSDYDCPYCGTFHETANKISEEYKDDLVWVYRHFPLTQLHPEAMAKSIASECVAKLAGNEQFWDFSDFLFDL